MGTLAGAGLGILVGAWLVMFGCWGWSGDFSWRLAWDVWLGAFQGLLAGVGILAGGGLENFSWCQAGNFSWFWLGIFARGLLGTSSWRGNFS